MISPINFVFSPLLQELPQSSHIHFERTFSCAKNLLILKNFSLEEDFKTVHRVSERKLSGWIWNGDFIRSEGGFLQSSAK